MSSQGKPYLPTSTRVPFRPIDSVCNVKQNQVKASKQGTETVRRNKRPTPKLKSKVRGLVESEQELNLKWHCEFLEANRNLVLNIKKDLKSMILKNVNMHKRAMRNSVQ